MWFEVGIEGKDPMDKDEDDWGGRLEFGFSEKNFSEEVEDYFLMFEDQCTQQSHNCGGRVRCFSRLPYPVGKSSTIDESFLWWGFCGSVAWWFLTLSQFQSEF